MYFPAKFCEPFLITIFTASFEVLSIETKETKYYVLSIFLYKDLDLLATTIIPHTKTHTHVQRQTHKFMYVCACVVCAWRFILHFYLMQEINWPMKLSLFSPGQCHVTLTIVKRETQTKKSKYYFLARMY